MTNTPEDKDLLLDELKAKVRAMRYPDGHTGVPVEKYQSVHKQDESLLRYLSSQGYLQSPKDNSEALERLRGWCDAQDYFIREVLGKIDEFEEWRKSKALTGKEV